MVTICRALEVSGSYSDIAKVCKDSGKPVYITDKGHVDTVLLGIDSYERMRSELELLSVLMEAEGDAANERWAPFEDSCRTLREAFEEK